MPELDAVRPTYANRRHEVLNDDTVSETLRRLEEHAMCGFSPRERLARMKIRELTTEYVMLTIHPSDNPTPATSS